MDVTRFVPIGVIHSPFFDPHGMPIQPNGARDVVGWVEVKEEYQAGLKDLDGFSHIILIYQFHLSHGYALTVRPFLDDAVHGVFATRAPRRPNPIGLSVVRLVRLEGGRLDVLGVDMVDGTPLLDIKPFVPEFDAPQVERLGWLEASVGRASQMRSDNRFGGPD